MGVWPCRHRRSLPGCYREHISRSEERRRGYFLKSAVVYYQSLGVTVTCVMTDNGSCYRLKAFAPACTQLGLKRVRTRPFTPQANGKTERFIQTALREWAYATAFENSEQRKKSVAPLVASL